MKESPFLAGHPELLDQFKDLPFFQTFNPTELNTVFGASKLITYDPQEIIIKKGNVEQWFYILISGEVTVHDHEGEIQQLSHPGDIFGEFAMLGAKQRTASVVSTFGSTCLAIDGSAINLSDTAKRCAFYAVIYRVLAELLAGRIRATSEEISALKTQIDNLKGMTFGFGLKIK